MENAWNFPRVPTTGLYSSGLCDSSHQNVFILIDKSNTTDLGGNLIIQINRLFDKHSLEVWPSGIEKRLKGNLLVLQTGMQ